ncbi:c-type cytochrome [Shewanella dokdonensis]|uniref:c-type cytochrome n=1 Tax=Shewanella dokdonensis TaxID=712036 RepID=UPI00200E4C92|nr:c-type cytochrome [Shewanella dokdonensis]MCL1075556.1 c-type cytochrome [Shewanella dokdonensis]
MKILLFLGATLLLAPNLSQAQAAPVPEKAAICSSCHGIDGNSVVAEYPSLAGQRALYLQRQLQAFRAAARSNNKEGRADPIMSNMAAMLSDADITELAQYYALQPRQQQPGAAADMAQTGQQLYQGGDLSRDIAACAACHGLDGKGMAAAGFPALLAQHPHYLVEQLQKFKHGERKDDYQGMMQDTSAKLTEQDMQALAAYISLLPVD